MNDSLHDLAWYYDRIMEHVDYDRWEMVVRALTPLARPDFLHVDAACGTGRLLKRLLRSQWRSFGVDLSYPMIRAGEREGPRLPAAVADLRALPFSNSVDYITCLFDSINFLIELEDLARAFRAFTEALRPGGILYFDAVTERMVTQHFEGQEWIEQNGKFTTTWTSRYRRESGVVDTSIRVNHGASSVIRERIYTEEQLQEAVENAGLTLLGFYDAHNWKTPRLRTVRLDFVAAKKPAPGIRRRFETLATRIRHQLA